MLGTSIFAVAIVAVMGAFFGQSFLSAMARNINLAMNDATRVMEQIRQQNSGAGCTTPSAKPPGNFATWNAWLNAQNPAKSIRQGRVDAPSSQDNQFELIAVTCQDQDGGALTTDYCNPNQMGQEWKSGPAANPDFDPIRVTVAIGWRQNQRGIGQDFTYTSAGQRQQGKIVVQVPEQLSVGPDTDRDGVIESDAMITTVVTCL
jgi:type II secretory pathway pseudopilin PulG